MKRFMDTVGSGARRVLVAAIVVGIVSGFGSPEPGSSPDLMAQDVMALGPFAALEPGRYFIDADADSSTPLRVVYDIPAEGWSQWIGAARFHDDGHVGISITTVVNLVRDGCREHAWADPPVGPSVDELADALAALAPFQLTSPPEDVTAFGYRGKHLVLTTPDLLEAGADDLVEEPDVPFPDCVDGLLKSWVAPIDTAEPGDAFYGYTGPGYVEEIWLLDVDGTRLMIAAERSLGSPSEDVAEQQAILESIVIEP